MYEVAGSLSLATTQILPRMTHKGLLDIQGELLIGRMTLLNSMEASFHISIPGSIWQSRNRIDSGTSLAARTGLTLPKKFVLVKIDKPSWQKPTPGSTMQRLCDPRCAKRLRKRSSWTELIQRLPYGRIFGLRDRDRLYRSMWDFTNLFKRVEEWNTDGKHGVEAALSDRNIMNGSGSTASV